jgi:hypothetical protein
MSSLYFYLKYINFKLISQIEFLLNDLFFLKLKIVNKNKNLLNSTFTKSEKEPISACALTTTNLSVRIGLELTLYI